MDCPKCIGKLDVKPLTHRKIHDIEELKGAGLSYELELDQCFVCGGVWLDKGELNKYLTDKITVIDSPSLGSKTDNALDQKAGDCPCCKSVKMEKKPAPQAEHLIIDQCPRCGGIWLDSTEIDRLERTQKEAKGPWKAFLASFKRK